MKITLGENSLNEGKIRRRDFVERQAATDHASLGWTQWTKCRAPNNQGNIGVQARWRVCTGNRVCGREQRQCLLPTTKRFKQKGETQTKIKRKLINTKQTLATIFPFNKFGKNTKQTKTQQQQRGEGIIETSTKTETNKIQKQQEKYKKHQQNINKTSIKTP
uniref:Uncharacterized protein n=1 Tax=Meloidogyne enterolobii TaxID=390850 RepID=A0A6V7UN50_MELEN|nr:unnamed protein product [Meloidogyne enterolobii]